MNALRAFLISLLLLGACADEEKGQRDAVVFSREMSAVAAVPEAAPRARPVSAQQDDAADIALPGTHAALPAEVPASMIVRTGSATIEVGSVEEAVEQLRRLAARVGGYIANANMQAGRERLHHARLEIKLPAERWDEAVGGLSAIGRVLDAQVNAHDMAIEYVDLQARLENARHFERRMVELLARRTGNLEEVLSVERELARIREQIERYEGRLRHLRSSTSMSTLMVTVQEPQPLVGAYRGANVLAEAFRTAWRNFVGFVAGFIAALGVVLPVAVLLLVLLLAARRGRRWMRGSWAEPEVRSAAPGHGE
jgi:hypothetical protein